ncbi:MAG: NAD(P)-dependent glycerol-3-phosphate dehydrogenase [Chloroflexi bacterium]|nr:NAD(P)-dependent glycerol-3-phosphate dehydrogenase [Chloroflexota bacterium]
MSRIAIIGTTSWGTTLGIVLARKGLDVLLWARTSEEARRLSTDHENKRLLPGFSFPDNLRVTDRLSDACASAEAVIFAVPSKSLRENVRITGGYLPPHALIVSATKGLEVDTAKRMTEVLQEEIAPSHHPYILALSGPNLSREIASGLPASSVVAAREESVAAQAQQLLMTPRFRVYTNTDVIGVEMGGALKNIIALGAGISDGLGFGDNAKAAFITRGLAEITRLGVGAGANPLTFAGLACLGDLIATCASPLSRNRYVGQELAKGRRLPDILAGMKHVAEGVDTTVAACRLARDLDTEMPISEMTYRVLFKGVDPRQAALDLMGRAPRPEWADTVR